MEFLSQFDARTTGLLIGIGFVIQAFSIGVQARFIKEYRGVGFALLGNISIAAGFSLLLFRDVFAPLLTIIIANLLILLCPILYYLAVSRFSGQAHYTIIPPLFLVIYSITFIYFTYINDNLPVRVVILSLLASTSLILIFIQLWKVRGSAYRGGAILVMSAFTVYALFLLFRIIHTILAPPDRLFQNTPAEIATYILLFVLSSLWSTGFVLMISQRLQADLSELATTDPLTRIPNRRGIQNTLGYEISRSQRSGDPFSILLIDIDNFKQVNDSYGHAVGDAVLIQTAEIFHTTIRNQDFLGRWGGEEFLIVLPDTSIEQAKILASRLQKNLAIAMEAEPKLKITISIGIASSNGEDTISSLLKRCDDALYVAKSTRDTIVTAN